MAVGGAHREAERVVDLVRSERLVVAHEARKDRHARRVGGGPAFGPPVVRLHVEERPRPALPARAVPAHVVQLEEVPVVPLDDQHVAVAVDVAAVARVATFDPVVLGDGLVGNRVEGERGVAVLVVHAVALVGEVEVHRLERQLVHDDVREADDVGRAREDAAEVGMERAAVRAVVDEVDVGVRVAVHGPGADVPVPPVVRWEEGQLRRQRPVARGRRELRRRHRVVRTRRRGCQEQERENGHCSLHNWTPCQSEHNDNGTRFGRAKDSGAWRRMKLSQAPTVGGCRARSAAPAKEDSRRWRA